MEKRNFLILYRKHAEKLYNFIRWTTAGNASSNDILQNVFIKVLNGPEAPENDDECGKWLIAIARNACIDHYRSASRFSRLRKEYNLELKNSPDTPERFSAWKEVSRLPETERSILYLHLKIGYTYKEIAKMLDMNESQIRVKAFRALHKLREILTGSDYNEYS